MANGMRHGMNALTSVCAYWSRLNICIEKDKRHIKKHLSDGASDTINFYFTSTWLGHDIVRERPVDCQQVVGMSVLLYFAKHMSHQILFIWSNWMNYSFRQFV